MERTHKLSPKWRGPFKVNKIPNPFQVHYEDEGREKVTHVRNCKKFRGLTSNGNNPTVVAKECRIDAQCHCRFTCQRRMTRHIIDVLAEGSKWTFQNPDQFVSDLGRGRSTPVIYTFTALPWPYMLLCTPVLGRRVGRTQMEESKTLGNGSLNVYGQIQKSTME